MASWPSQRSEPLQHPYLSCPPAESVVLAGPNPPCTKSLPTRVGRRPPPAAAFPCALAKAGAPCTWTHMDTAGGKRSREKRRKNKQLEQGKFRKASEDDEERSHEWANWTNFEATTVLIPAKAKEFLENSPVVLPTRRVDTLKSQLGRSTNTLHPPRGHAGTQVPTSGCRP